MHSIQNIKRLIVSGRLQAASAQCRRALAVSPDSVELWLLLAACSQYSDQEETRRALRRAGERAEASWIPEIVEVMIKVRAFDLALPALERLDDTDRDVARLKARCLWGLGAYRDAIDLSAELLQRHPEDAELAFGYAQMAINLGRAKEARRVSAEALQQHPSQSALRAQNALLTLSLEGVEPAWRVLESLRSPVGFVRRLRSALKCLAEGKKMPGLDPHPVWQGFEFMLHAGGPRMRWFGDNASLLAHALKQLRVEGAIVECGVYHGRTVSLLAEWGRGRKIYGFDSFEGLPEQWTSKEAPGSYSLRGAVPDVPPSVTLVKGWFEQTLPSFAAELDQPIALLHVDCDIYSSTRDVLQYLGPRLVSGSMVVFDEYTGYDGWQEHEYRAWREFVADTGLEVHMVAGHLLGKTVSYTIESANARRPD